MIIIWNELVGWLRQFDKLETTCFEAKKMLNNVFLSFFITHAVSVFILGRFENALQRSILNERNKKFISI